MKSASTNRCNGPKFPTCAWIWLAWITGSVFSADWQVHAQDRAFTLPCCKHLRLRHYWLPGRGNSY